MKTTIFGSNSAKAVRIPAELAYERNDIEFDIERVGDALRIRPARRSLNGVLAKSAAFDDGSWRKSAVNRNKWIEIHL